MKIELGQDFTKRGSRLEFVRVWLQQDSNTIKAFPTGSQSSAWMSSFADATALLPFPAENRYPKVVSIMSNAYPVWDDGIQRGDNKSFCVNWRVYFMWWRILTNGTV